MEAMSAVDRAEARHRIGHYVHVFLTPRGQEAMADYSEMVGILRGVNADWIRLETDYRVEALRTSWVSAIEAG